LQPKSKKEAILKRMTTNACGIKKIVAEKLGLHESDILDEHSFTKNFAIDSLDFFELIMEVEKRYNIKITDENSSKITTVSSLIDYVNEHTTGILKDNSATIYK
jgi:acyl carrier protein